MACCELQRLY